MSIQEKKLLIFGNEKLVPPGLELGTFRMLSGRDNHYTTGLGRYETYRQSYCYKWNQDLFTIITFFYFFHALSKVNHIVVGVWWYLYKRRNDKYTNIKLKKITTYSYKSHFIKHRNFEK